VRSQLDPDERVREVAEPRGPREPRREERRRRKADNAGEVDEKKRNSPLLMSAPIAARSASAMSARLKSLAPSQPARRGREVARRGGAAARGTREKVRE
jgi:hypothetical protein